MMTKSAKPLWLGGILLLSAFAISVLRAEQDIYKSLDTFCDVISIIQRDYIEKLSADKLVSDSIRGMLSSLDNYSHFIPAEKLKDETKAEEEKEILNTYGLEVAYKDGLLTVVSPVENGPAWRAGVKPGDRIIKVNEEAVSDHPLGDVVIPFRGRAKEKFKLTILRRGELDFIETELEPGKIEGPPAASRNLGDRIGLIRISRFENGTVSEVSQQIESLKGAEVNSLILDLRDCPAGDVIKAIGAAELFLPSGKTVTSLEGRREGVDKEYTSRQAPLFAGGPIVLLVNEGTSGGAEVFSGALRDSRKAILMGRNTFGSAFEEGRFPLKDGAAISIITGVYKTPSGKIIQEKGLKVDIEVPLPALPEDKEAIEGEKKEKKKEEEKVEETDQMVQRAVDLIKAIRLTQI